MADIFVSYARVDKARVAPLVAALEAQGWSVWWDPAITPGQEFDSLIRQELGAARAVIVVWTPTSVDSRWVRGEARLGAERGVLVPVRFDKAELPIDALSLHTTDLDDWNGDAEAASFRDLCRALKVLTGQGQSDRSAASPAAPPQPASSMPKRVTPIHLAIAVAVIAVLGGGLFLLSGHDRGANAGKPAATQAAPSETAAAPAGVSLAVLPFVNMSDDREQEYFSDGLSEELLNQLAQIKNLRVAGRTSSFAFKGKNEDLRKIAEALGVNHLLEGSVRKAGDQLRITAQLINATDGSHLWSQSYDRELKDVFKVQEDIAKDVAGALSVTLGVGETARPEGGTTNIEANDKYLRARALASQLGVSELTQAAEDYRQAVALDPNFALAWYGLYATLVQLLQYAPERAPATLKAMEEASARIMSLVPDTWWAKSVRLSQLVTQHRWIEADAEARAVIAAAPPSDPDAAFVYSQFVGAVGRQKESVEYLKRARQSDPLSLEISGYLQLALMVAGHLDEAQAEYARSESLTGNHARWDFFDLLRMPLRNDYDPATVAAKLKKYLSSETFHIKFNQALADNINNRDAALAILRNALKDPENQDLTHLTVIAAWAAAYFDDIDLALTAMKRNLVDMNSPIVGALWISSKAGFRSDPRFKEIVRDLKLYDYWRASGNWGDFCHPAGSDDFECR
ncbi:MAG: TIR domain-containing protein [Alphaproteobacteria bacterium]